MTTTEPTSKEVANYDVIFASSTLLKKKRRIALTVKPNTAEVKFNILEPASDTKKFLSNINFDLAEDIIEWKVDQSFFISDVEIVKRQNEVCFLKVPGKKKVKEALFKSENEAYEFCTFVEKFQKHLEEDDDVVVEENEEKVLFLKSEITQAVPTTKTPAPKETQAAPTNKDNTTALRKMNHDEVTLLIEIVSARDLAGPNFSTLKADPYVLVTRNSLEVHRTKHIDNEMNPIWTVLSNSLFVLEVNDANEELLFFVNDFNALRKHSNLGHVAIKLQDLVDANGKRLSYRLLAPKSVTVTGSRVVVKERYKNFTAFGKLSLRARVATERDYNFVAKLKRKEGFTDTLCDIDDMIIGQHDEAKKGLFQSYKKHDSNGQIKYLVRPCPDYKRVNETKWLTKSQVESESLRESYSWLDVGSGTLAKIHLEIIGCDNLPNTDESPTDLKKENKTDACCCIVYEDSIICTETIKDCLSPRWMPWTQRAFILHTTSVYAHLRIGVFDKDSGIKMKIGGQHDYIGRIEINLSNYKVQTEYLLTFNLRGADQEKELIPYGQEGKCGTITIRLRLESPDPRALLLSCLTIPEKSFVNVNDEKQYELAKKVICGVNDENAYNLDNIFSHYMELMEYQTIVYYLMNGFYAVLLWRGHFALDVYLPQLQAKCFQKTTIYLPLYSMILFVSGVTLIESPTLMIPYFFLSIGCIMLALMSYKNANPSPWIQTKTFDDYLSIFLFGKQLSVQKNDEIKPNQNKDEARLYMKEIEDRLLAHQKEQEEQMLEYTKAQEEQVKFNTEVGKLEQKCNIAMKANREAMLMTPFKSIIYPYQLMLANIVYMLRFTSSIFLWENSFASFWITFLSFSLFLVCLIIPWSFILTWLTRILVWLLLGPWMKLADIYYFTPLEQLSPEEQALQKEQARKLRHETYDTALEQYRIKQEDAIKLRDAKKCMYGDYIVSVPHFHLPKLKDRPLPKSSARRFDGEVVRKKPFHVSSQHLVGKMIPIPVDEAIAIANEEKEEEMKSKPPPSVSSFLRGFIFRGSDESTVPLKSETKSYGGTD